MLYIKRAVRENEYVFFFNFSRREDDVKSTRKHSPWSGNVGFPGGRRDAEDRDDFDTAIRETREEIGLDLEKGFKFVARLDDIPAYHSGKKLELCISPFIFCAPSTISLSDLVMDKREIAAACFVPIDAIDPSVVHYSSIEKDYAHFLIPPLANLLSTTRQNWGLQTVRFPSITLNNINTSSTHNDISFELWGLTFRMTEHFLFASGLRNERLTSAPVRFENRGAGRILNLITPLLRVSKL